MTLRGRAHAGAPRHGAVEERRRARGGAAGGRGGAAAGGEGAGGAHPVGGRRQAGRRRARREPADGELRAGGRVAGHGAAAADGRRQPAAGRPAVAGARHVARHAAHHHRHPRGAADGGGERALGPQVGGLPDGGAAPARQRHVRLQPVAARAVRRTRAAGRGVRVRLPLRAALHPRAVGRRDARAAGRVHDRHHQRGRAGRLRTGHVLQRHRHVGAVRAAARALPRALPLDARVARLPADEGARGGGAARAGRAPPRRPRRAPRAARHAALAGGHARARGRRGGGRVGAGARAGAVAGGAARRPRHARAHGQPAVLGALLHHQLHRADLPGGRQPAVALRLLHRGGRHAAAGDRPLRLPVHPPRQEGPPRGVRRGDGRQPLRHGALLLLEAHGARHSVLRVAAGSVLVSVCDSLQHRLGSHYSSDVHGNIFSETREHGLGSIGSDSRYFGLYHWQIFLHRCRRYRCLFLLLGIRHCVRPRNGFRCRWGARDEEPALGLYTQGAGRIRPREEKQTKGRKQEKGRVRPCRDAIRLVEEFSAASREDA